MPRDTVLDALDVRPEIARTAREHLEAVMQGGRVPQVTKELCAAMVSAVNFCQPSVTEHRRRAAELGVDADTLNALWDYARSDRFTGAQKAALAAAVALTREPRALPQAVRAELQAHYDEGEIVEVLCAIGAFNYFNRISNALQTQIAR
jgi:uncharacterized peroxidase-related enzyme